MLEQKKAEQHTWVCCKIQVPQKRMACQAMPFVSHYSSQVTVTLITLVTRATINRSHGHGKTVAFSRLITWCSEGRKPTIWSTNARTSYLDLLWLGCATLWQTESRQQRSAEKERGSRCRSPWRDGCRQLWFEFGNTHKSTSQLSPLVFWRCLLPHQPNISEGMAKPHHLCFWPRAGVANHCELQLRPQGLREGWNSQSQWVNGTMDPCGSWSALNSQIGQCFGNTSVLFGDDDDDDDKDDDDDNDDAGFKSLRAALQESLPQRAERLLGSPRRMPGFVTQTLCFALQKSSKFRCYSIRCTTDSFRGCRSCHRNDSSRGGTKGEEWQSSQWDVCPLGVAPFSGTPSASTLFWMRPDLNKMGVGLFERCPLLKTSSQKNGVVVSCFCHFSSTFRPSLL